MPLFLILPIIRITKRRTPALHLIADQLPNNNPLTTPFQIQRHAHHRRVPFYRRKSQSDLRRQQCVFFHINIFQRYFGSDKQVSLVSFVCFCFWTMARERWLMQGTL
jgi:hypothetical protein